MKQCRCTVEDGVQVLWCQEHNGWAYARQLDKLRGNLETALTDAGLPQRFLEITERLVREYGLCR